MTIENIQETVRVELYLKGDEAKRFLQYQKREKLTSRAQTAYKLTLETLDREVPDVAPVSQTEQEFAEAVS